MVTLNEHQSAARKSQPRDIAGYRTRYSFEDVLGNSPVMQQAFKRARQAAMQDMRF